MIVRPSGRRLLLITQPDHAALAGTFMRAWQADGLPTAKDRDAILLAIQAHDDGWAEEDHRPMVDTGSGRILDFINAPTIVKQRVWPSSVERLSDRPYAAALVAQHAITVYRSNRPDPEWASFFRTLEGLRDGMLASCRSLTLDDLARDYFFVRAGDLMSLVFCHAWTTSEPLDGYELRLEGPRLRITPDPFGGREVEFAIQARQIAGDRFTPETAAEAFRTAPIQTLAGVASGQ